VVSELLFSAGVGCCFTQPRTPRFHHVPCLAIGHRIIFGPKAPYLNSKTQNPSSGQMMTTRCPVSDYTYLWTDDDPQHQGAPPRLLCPPWQPPTWHFELCSCRLYISPSSPMQAVTSFKHSTLLLCTCSLPTTTVWLKLYPLKAEQARRRHGLQKERTHRPTSTSTPS
jgi:hypothetical protein